MSDGEGIIAKAAGPAVIAAIEKMAGGLANLMVPAIAEKRAEAMQIRTQGMIDASEMANRAEYRLIWQKGNIAGIAKKIPEHMSQSSSDEEKAEKIRNMDTDIAAHAAEKCKNVSDEYVSSLWAKALAGEADNPGSFSKKTADVVGALDRNDAELFVRFCQFVWVDKGNNISLPLIYDYEADIYAKAGISYSTLDDLESLELISHKSDGFAHWYQPQSKAVWGYHENYFMISARPDVTGKSFVNCGYASLTRAGTQLYSLCKDQVRYNPEFQQYVISHWTSEGLNPKSI